MNHKTKPVLWLAICLGLSACGSLREALYGREQTLAPLSTATLGATTRDDVVRQYGMPDEIDTRRLDDTLAEAYFYVDHFGRDGAWQYRFLSCEFQRGVLRAYAYHEWVEDAPGGFDESVRNRLMPGQSARPDVEKLLGPPQGKALLPTTINLEALRLPLGGPPFPLAKIPQEAAEAWQYYSPTFGEGRRKSGQKTLSVFFDAQGHYLGSVLLHEAAIRYPL